MNLRNPLCRFVAKVLIFLMMAQSWPFWDLSQSHKWDPKKFLGTLSSMVALLGPGEAHAASSEVDTAFADVVPCFQISARAKSGKVQLIWADQGAERYDIYRAAQSDPSNFQKIGETTSTYATYLDETVQNEMTFLYVVAAVSGGTECYSNVISSHPTASRGRFNYAPIIYSLPITQGTTGIAYNYDVNATDPNGDALSYSLVTAPAGMSIDAATGLIQWTPAAAQVGTQNVTVQVSDGRGGSATQSYVIIVASVLTSVPDVVGLPQVDAEAAILAVNLSVGAISTANSTTVPAGNVIAQNPVGGTVVPELSPVDLVVSLGPVTVAVPDVVGLAQAAAEAAIVAANLVVGTTTTANSNTVPAGNVISQNPVAGTAVAQGSAVDLVVSLGPPPVAVPDVVGLPQVDAEAAILAVNLSVGAISTANSTTVPAGNVIAQNPVAGTVVPELSPIDLWISSGPPPVAVPDVVGLSQSAADAAIVAANLVVGTISTANSDTVPAGDVISQNPVAGTVVPEGSAVDFVVSLGPVTVAVPDVVGLSQSAADAAIVAANLVVGTITTANSNTVPAGDVISQNPVAGTVVPEGSAVDFLVSLGPVTVAVPDVVGLSQSAADAAIVAANLIVGTITTANSNTVPAGDVISQNPVAGTVVPEGSAVDLLVSLGPVTVAVPDVVGLSQSAADAAIVAANLVVGTITTANSNTVPAGDVISQNPVAGTVVPEGSAVDLLVSLGPVTVAVPDVVGLSQSAADAAIVAANLIVGTITTANSDTVPAGDVISQNPVAGTVVPEGSAVDLLVSLGPVTVAVPDVVGLSQSAADAAIVAANLVVGTITTANSDTVPAGDVISQNPVAGTVVPELSPVDLLVSLGPAVGQDFTRPEVTVSANPTAANVGDTVIITVNTVDNVGVVSTELLVDGVAVPLDATGAATYSSPNPGVFTAVGRAVDNAGNEGLASTEFRFLSPGDTTPPTVAITGPADEAALSLPTDIIGTASDANLTRYTLEYSVKDRNEFFLFHTGTWSVTNDVLGRLDPTVLRNGLYDVKLTAEDVSGNTVSLTRTYQLEGEAKVGNFTISFDDLTIPMAGVDITIARTYDSRMKSQGDFGIGWTLELKSVALQENRVPGEGWEIYCTQSIFGTCIGWGIRPNTTHTVLVTFPDGSDHEFNVQENTTYAQPNGLVQGNLTFAAQPGTFSTLQALDSTTYDFLLGGELLDTGFNLINPDRYRLTEVDGTEFVTNQFSGLESITDPNGNTITLGAGGIIHSAGKSVTFTRDAAGRITTITDPLGNTIQYAYDFYGDLANVTDQEGNVTRFTYNSSHGLLDIIDPRGITPVRNEYDAEGRLISTTDADGNRIEFTHNVGTRQEVVRDRQGNVTVYEYDGDGNVISETDAVGNTTTSTYDANGNKLSETDALGNTTDYTYDAQGNVLSNTDPLGNVTTFTYNALGQALTITDPLGNVTTNTYDINGNKLTTTDPLVNTTTHTYDGSGNLRTTTDPLGNATNYGYDSFGNRISETDPLGIVTTFTYDANGNKLTETVTRTTPSGPQTLITSFVYDSLGRVITTVDPAGNSTITEYNALGKKSAETDASGNRTSFEYDARGHFFKTTHPDGTTETTTYDVNGNLETFTDRAGRVTTYTYDAVDRLTTTTYPDGTFTTTTYDAVDREISATDARGYTTTFAYDAAGRKISVTDPLGNVTTHTYDGAGNQSGFTDANGNTTTYQYDDNSRRTQTVFPDGTSTTTAYDAVGRTISETDQAGLTTSSTYDALGRITSVTDALGNSTSYAYDEVGNRTEQTDANGNTTRWEYDERGNVTKRTLPLGMSETFVYDAVGNMVSTTDFNGQMTLFAYDENNRVTTKTFPGSTSVLFTYNATGQRSIISDSRGNTTYTYDVRDRRIQVDEPDGTTISYTYDANGNRTSVTVPSGITTYTYDPLNRLETVTDPDGGITAYTYDSVGNRASVTYPNGTVATYTYDSLNRLTGLQNLRSDSSLISSYTYTLGPAGNRIRVTEDTGRIVDYTYDAVYKLVQEVITDPALGDQTIDYTYDPVGNRLTKTDPSGTTTYIYDANNRLLTEDDGATITTYTYDSNGNTLSKVAGVDTTTYAYDFENRLITVQTPADLIDYVYDADGIRVSSTVNGSFTSFLVDKNRNYAQVLEERDGAGNVIVSYVYGDDLISQNRSGTPSYYHYDGLGSTRALTDAGENSTDTYTYEAFGTLLGSTGSTENNYLFTGEQYDPNVGFYYLRARYYDAQIGRFVTMDPLAGSIWDPPSLHKYLYADANPVNMIDPSGYFSTLTGVMISIAIVSVLVSIAVPNYRRIFARFTGNTDRFSLQVVGGGALGQILFGGALAAFIWEEQPSDLSYYPHRMRGLFTVFMLGFGGGAKGSAAAGGVGPAGSATFQTATKRRIQDFQGIGRMTAIELGIGPGGVGIGAMQLPDGTYLDVGVGYGFGITWGAAGYVVMTVWWLRILEQLW